MPEPDSSAVQATGSSAVLPERGDKTTRLEAFVDAAFAFAVTLLVISGDHIPTSVEDLVLALKSVPTFAASFALILVFWNGHAQWSRCYGLDDAITRRLSLLLVFLVLVFVYPLRMVLAALFFVVSRGWLPSNFTFGNWMDVPVLFITYGIAFGALTGVMWMLYRHAWRLRNALALSVDECTQARADMAKWALLSLTSLVSILLALAMLQFGNARLGLWLGLPGYIYFVNHFTRALARRFAQRHVGES